MTSIVPAQKYVKEDLEFEIEVLSPIDLNDIKDPQKREIALAVRDLDGQIAACEEKVKELDAEIDRLTNHADGLDYAVAVASGVLTGLIDSFLVGETNLDIEEIQKKLEDKYHVANDSAFQHKTTDGDGNSHSVSSPALHRLEDLAHHPTLCGLIASILARFFRIAIFSNGDGKTKIFHIDENANPEKAKKEKSDMCVAWALAALSGIMFWLGSMAKKKYEEETGEDIPAPLRKIIDLIAATPAIIDILLAVDKWAGHIASDVSTSAGIPGIFTSLLKEISMLPILNKTGLPKYVQHLYTSKANNISKYAGVVFEAVKKQAIPVLINEVIVRGFYFVRHLINEYKKENSFEGIEWQNVIPFGNRTVERMMTIASATFTAVDMADAAIRSGGNATAFLTRVNFVGVGRLAVAVVIDVGMGTKRNGKINERIKIMSEQITLLNAKVYYRCAELHIEERDMLEQQKYMWIAAENTQQTLTEVYEIAEESVVHIGNSLEEMRENFERISQYRDAIEEHNPGLKRDLTNISRWGKK